MFCKNCGKEIPDGSRFCNACGIDLTVVRTEAVPKTKQPVKETGKVDYNDYLSDAKTIDIFSIIFSISAIILVIALFFVPIFLTTTIPDGGSLSNYDPSTGIKSFSIFEELQFFIYAGQNNLPMNWWGNFEFILAVIPLFALLIWCIYILIRSIGYLLNNKKSALVKISVLRKPRTRERAAVIFSTLIFVFCILLDISLLQDSSSFFEVRYMTGFCGISAWSIVHLLCFIVYITLYILKSRKENMVKNSIKEFEKQH